ncbi:MAG: DUF4263 domain-containing protein [Sphingomonas bacterium]
MVRFEVNDRAVILEYEPDFNSPAWVLRQLQTHQEVTVSKAFTFTSGDLLDGPTERADGGIDEFPFRFRFAARRNGYFQIPGRILDIPNDVLIDEQHWLERKTFVAERNVGIFRRIAKVKGDSEPIIIGGELDGNIPLATFSELLNRFPNSGEIDRYASARVETIIGEFFDGMRSAREKYENYLSRRKSSVSDAPLPQETLLQAEINKFIYLSEVIIDWLRQADAYSERDWQRMILKIILLLFPKYVAVLENVEIPDYYTTPGRVTRRFIDICLIDAGGNIDVIEIKKPFDNVLLGKTLYRDNNVPTRELSGSIMQAEKYLFHLSKWGVAGEHELTKRYEAQLPRAMTIRVTNPKAMILLGRDRLPSGQLALTDRQLFDLEVIKRKYANMMDIMSYDDLLRRLDNIIASLVERRAAPTAAAP